MSPKNLLPFAVALGLLVAPASKSFAEDAAPAAAEAPAAKPAHPQGPGAVTPKAKASAKGAAKAPEAKGIHLAPITPVAQSVNVHEATLEKCNIQSLLPQQIAQRNPDVVLSDAPGGTTLELRIVDVHAPNGGLFSGPKWVTVEGTLKQGKTVKGSFTAKETSMASATACGMLSKVVTVLAGDIASWLANPTKGAMLGSAR